jgi:hypothetical protein
VGPTFLSGLSAAVSWDSALSKVSITRFLLLAAICFLVIVPFFYFGNPSGHDFEFHMFSWMEVLSQWKQGITYPRWAALEHWSFGEARFLFYPPASWTLGAALGSCLPWWVVPGVFIWIALFLAGVFMFHLARRWLSPPDALFAAVLYAVNPYHLLIVYWRSAFAELLASALLPLLLLCAMRLEEKGMRPVLGLSLILSAAWLTNAPSAVMIHYSFALFVTLLAVLNRSWRLLARAAAAILLGAGLASFYLIPAAYEEKWVNIGEVLGPGVRPQDNFLFSISTDVDHTHFNLLVSSIAVAEMLVVAAAVWISRAWRTTQQKIWILLTAWAAASSLVMFSITNVFWVHLPKLRFMQLPWRWLLCLNVALALLLTMAVSRWSVRALLVLALTVVVILAGHWTQPPWWDGASDIREMATAMSDGTGNEGTDEYVPAGADPYELNKAQPRIVKCGAGISARDCVCGQGIPARLCTEAPAQVLAWGAVEKHFKVVQAPASENLVLRLFNYPAWQASINGYPITTETTDVTGQMVIPIHAGTNDVRIRFRPTPDRTLGDAISVLSLCLALATWWSTRPSARQIPKLT